MPSRTAEFKSCVQSAKLRLANSRDGTSTPEHKQRLLQGKEARQGQRSEFARGAAQIAKDIQGTMGKLEKLAQRECGELGWAVVSMHGKRREQCTDGRCPSPSHLIIHHCIPPSSALKRERAMRVCRSAIQPGSNGTSLSPPSSCNDHRPTVAKRKTLFDDRPVEISELTYIIKRDIANLNGQIAKLQGLAGSGGAKGSKQAEEHNSNVLVMLQGKLASTSMGFKDVLELRTQVRRWGCTAMR